MGDNSVSRKRARNGAALAAIGGIGGVAAVLAEGGVIQMYDPRGVGLGCVTLADAADDDAPFAGAVWSPPADCSDRALAMHDRARAILVGDAVG